MSLSLKISATEEKNSIYIYDCTGKADGSNKGGYGFPNSKSEDAISATLEIKLPGYKKGDELLEINVFPGMPNKDQVPFELLPYQLGMEEIESGQYQIKYTVITEDKNGKNTYTAYYTLFCVKSVTCCIDKKVKHVRAGGMKDPKQKLIIELSNLLESVEYQVECGNYDTATETMDYLKEQCKCCGCS